MTLYYLCEEGLSPSFFFGYYVIAVKKCLHFFRLYISLIKH